MGLWFGPGKDTSVQAQSFTSLRFDPSQYRSRYIATLEDPKVLDLLSRREYRLAAARAEWHIAAIKNLSDEWLSKAFENRAVNFGIKLDSPSGLKDATTKYADLLLKLSIQVDDKGMPINGEDKSYAERIDPSKPFTFSFMAPAQFYFGFQIKPKGTVLWG